MHRLNFLFLLVAVCFSSALQGQTFQIFFETFNGPTSIFDLNTAGPGGSPLGSNTWIINDEYNGAPIYVNTPTQDSTFFGTINSAPTSKYLHIHDSNTSTVTNANYDPTIASDNFAEVSASFCTLGLTDVTFSFFYTCDGNTDDFGEVYYQADGGPWVQVGEARYNNKDQWQFEEIMDGGFNDVEDLKFGFRWVNGTSTPVSGTSFSVDDVVLVATYDTLSSPVDITITSFAPDPVCQEDNLLIFWELSSPLCEGSYEIELSAAGGSFAGATTGLGVFTIAANDTTGAIFTLPIPGTTSPDTCYRIRLNRLSPTPSISGVATVCFEVQDCPNTITTLQPVVTLDSNDVCINSVIDVPFFSTGAFITGNTYTAELSNEFGNFDSLVQVLGTLNSSATFDPSLGSPPGTVSGLVPETPPGCNYYIRVVSNIPVTTGSIWGPFCIQECDIETNEVEDIFVCIGDSTGVTVDVPYDINVFDSIAMYCDSNNFQIQILDPMFFSEVSLGDLGLVVSDEDSSILMTVPGYFDLLALGLDAGVWYMRIIGDCTSDIENSLGTVIHLTIGAPADNASELIPVDTLVCEGGLASFLVDPYNFDSDYQFQFLPGGTPFIWPFNPILVDLAGFTGELALVVREINFGCAGPWSDTATIDVIDEPILSINAPDPVCTGDTIQLDVPFFVETFYSWTTFGGNLVDTSNNVIRMVYDTPGVYDVQISALNICGSGDNVDQIEVVGSTPVNAGDDKFICIGETVTLNGSTPDIVIYEWYAADTLADIGSIFENLSPDSTESFVLWGTNIDGCVDRDTLTIFVDYPRTEQGDSTEICPGATAEIDAGFPGSNYDWSGIPDGQTSQIVTVNEPGFYSVVINSPDESCPVTKEFEVTEIFDICEALIFIPNAFSPNGDGSNDYFTTFGQSVFDYQIDIWNRWGELVYHSEDVGEISNMNDGWDGRFQGEEQEIGTYVYRVRVVGGDGNAVEKVGELYLVR